MELYTVSKYLEVGSLLYLSYLWLPHTTILDLEARILQDSVNWLSHQPWDTDEEACTQLKRGNGDLNAGVNRRRRRKGGTTLTLSSPLFPGLCILIVLSTLKVSSFYTIKGYQCDRLFL